MVTYSSLGTVAAAYFLDTDLSSRVPDALIASLKALIMVKDPIKVQGLDTMPDRMPKLGEIDLARDIDTRTAANRPFELELRKLLLEIQAPPEIEVLVIGPGKMFNEDTMEPAFRQTLRVALAMRGGVSLAVWIGGCIAELDVLRQIRLRRRKDTGDLVAVFITGQEPFDVDPLKNPLLKRAIGYATLMAQAGYDQILFDILAGASAGGLNGVLYSVAQRAGASPADVVQQLWEQEAGLLKLLRSPGWERVDSLLSGDDYLFTTIRAALDSTYSSENRHDALIADKITVDLSATIIDSDHSSNPDGEEGRGGFHFDGFDGNVFGNQIPSWPLPSNGPEAAHAQDQLERLAYAARSTSSFPGAFEPASIYSMSGGLKLEKTLRPNMRFAFGAHRDPGPLPTDNQSPQETFYRVVDGGVFDNIPIGRALTATQTRASTVPASRAIIYLDPDSPADFLPDRSRNERLSQLSETVRASVSRLKRRESVDAEVEKIIDYKNLLWLDKGRAESLAATLSEDWSDEVREKRRRAYIRYRSTADMAILTKILGAPEEWQLTSLAVQRRAFTAMNNEERQGLDVGLIQHDVLVSRRDSDSQGFLGVLGDPQALLDACQCAFRWTKSVETILTNMLSPAQIVSLRQLRQNIYTLLSNATGYRDHLILQVLEANQQAVNGEAHSAIINAWRTASVSVGADAIRKDWEALGKCLGQLRELSMLPGSDDWNETPWKRLVDAIGVSDTNTRFDPIDLAPALAAVGIPPVAENIHYWRIGSDEEPAVVQDFEALLHGDRRERLKLVLSQPHLKDSAVSILINPSRTELPAQAKLAGNALANFAAFLNKDWRTNDWWWGRMDAASGISRFLHDHHARLVPLIREEDAIPDDDNALTGFPTGPKDRIRWLQDRLLEEQHKARNSNTQKRKQWRNDIRGGADSTDDLGRGYLVALASRGLRVLWRAAKPDRGVGSWLSTILHTLLTPLLVLVPLLLDPAKLAIVAATSFVGLWFLESPGSFHSPNGDRLLWLWVLVPALFAAQLAVLLAGRRRWKTILNSVDPGGDLRREYAEYRRGSTLKAALGVAASIVLLLPLVISFDGKRYGTGAACLLMIVFLIAASYRWAGTLLRPLPIVRPWRDKALSLGALAVVVMLPSATTLWSWTIERERWGYLVGGVVLFLIATLLLSVWQKWLATLLTALIASVAATGIAYGIHQLPAQIFWIQPWAGIGILVALIAWGSVVWWLPDRSSATLKNVADDVVT